MKLRQLKVLFTFALFMLAYNTYGNRSPKVVSPIDKQLQRILQTEGIPGMAISYIENGYIRYRQTVLNPDVVKSGAAPSFNVNSSFPSRISQELLLKTNIMKLVELGKLSLDRSITDYLGAPFDITSKELKGITLRHLLTHTAGITPNPILVQKLWAESADLTDLCTSLKKRLDNLQQINRMTVFTGNVAGEVYEFSELGSLIAQCVINKVSDPRSKKRLPQDWFTHEKTGYEWLTNTEEFPNENSVQGRELIQCLIGEFMCWKPAVSESSFVMWLPNSLSHFKQVEFKGDRVRELNQHDHSFTTMNEMTRLLLSLLQKDDTSYRKNLLTEESIDEFFVVQFPLSEDYMYRMFGLYLGEERFTAESDEQGVYTYVFLDRKDENCLIVMVPMKNNYKVQQAIAKLIAYFRL